MRSKEAYLGGSFALDLCNGCGRKREVLLWIWGDEGWLRRGWGDWLMLCPPFSFYQSYGQPSVFGMVGFLQLMEGWWRGQNFRCLAKGFFCFLFLEENKQLPKLTPLVFALPNFKKWHSTHVTIIQLRLTLVPHINEILLNFSKMALNIIIIFFFKKKKKPRN